MSYVYQISYFFQKIGSDMSCELSPGDNLHEMSNPLSWEKSEKKNIMNLSFAEFACRVVKIKSAKKKKKKKKYRTTYAEC